MEGERNATYQHLQKDEPTDRERKHKPIKPLPATDPVLSIFFFSPRPTTSALPLLPELPLVKLTLLLISFSAFVSGPKLFDLPIPPPPFPVAETEFALVNPVWEEEASEAERDKGGLVEDEEERARLEAEGSREIREEVGAVVVMVDREDFDRARSSRTEAFALDGSCLASGFVRDFVVDDGSKGLGLGLGAGRRFVRFMRGKFSLDRR